MRNLTTSASLSVLTLAALMMLPQSATAGCVPGVRGDAGNNTCVGINALAGMTEGARNNTAIGSHALKSLKGAPSIFDRDKAAGNTAVGAGALAFTAYGSGNTAVGVSAQGFNDTGSFNVAMGVAALGDNTKGWYNVAIGVGALGASNIKIENGNTNSYNTAVGYYAGLSQSGRSNVSIGTFAGSNQRDGNHNIAIGAEGSDRDSKTIRIGKQDTQTQTFIAGIRGATIKLGSVVMVDANGQLGVMTSSARYKQDIAPMGDASSRLMNLRPVSFRYKEVDSEGNKPLQYGLIAEEVDKVMPDLVIRNADGSVETVAYQYLPSLLLNEYQKQNRELAETKAQLDAMQQEMAAMKLALGRLAAAAPQGSTLAAFKAEGAVALK
jgi:hypothetical protein